MDETYGTYVDDECLAFMTIMMILIMILMIMLSMLMVILMKILMMILMMVGAGTEDRSLEEPYSFASPRSSWGGSYKFSSFGSCLGEGKGEGKQ